MRLVLHVWLRAQHSPLAVWHEATSQWQTLEGWQQLQDYVGYNGYKTNSSKTLCLYFPTSHMLQVDTALNPTQLKQLGNTGKQYLFEETSLTPIEQLVLRQTTQANLSYLYALAQHDIEAWQQSATLADLSIGALLPDFLLLPTPEEGAGQQVVLYQDRFTTLLRQADYQGVAVSYLPLIFDRLAHLSEVCTLSAIESDSEAGNNAPNNATNDAPNHSVASSVDPNSAMPIIDSDSPTELVNTDLPLALSTMGNDNPNVSAETAQLIAEQQLLLTPLAAKPKPVEHPQRHTLNFFTKSSDAKLSPYLRVALMVALSALVLQIATDAVQWYRYDAAATATQQTIGTQYQAWFPQERLNPRTKLETQLRPKLRTDTQASSSMAALARISPLIKQSSLQAQSLSIQPTALSFTLLAPDRNSLDQFAATLNEQGLNANLERISSNEQGQFSGQITVNIVDNSANESLATPATAGNATDS